MPERETIFLILLVIASLYIIFMDARPSIQSWLVARKSLPIAVVSPGRISSHCKHYSKDGSDEYIDEAIFLLGVSNKTRETLRNVTVSLMSFEGTILLPHIESREFKVDIQPGVFELFEVGRSLLAPGSICQGLHRGFETMPAADFDRQKMIARHAHFSVAKPANLNFGGRTQEEAPDPVFDLQIWVTSDNTQPVKADVEIWPETRNNPIRVVRLRDHHGHEVKPSDRDTLEPPGIREG